MRLHKPSKIFDERAKMMTAPVMFRQLALPLHPGDSVKWQIARSGRAAGVSPRRARSIWYGACNLWADEYHRICAAYESWLNSRERELDQEIAIIRARKAEREIEGKQYAIDYGTDAPRQTEVVARQSVDLGKGVK